jgi:hypothetical protein
MGNVAERAAYYENEVWFQNLLKLPFGGELNLDIVYPDESEKHLDEFSHQLTDSIYVTVYTDDANMEFKHGMWFVENCLFDPNVHNIILTFQIHDTDADVSVMPRFLSHFPDFDIVHIMNLTSYGIRLDFLRNVSPPSLIRLSSNDHDAAQQLIANVPPELITQKLQDIMWDNLVIGGKRHMLSAGNFPGAYFNEIQLQALREVGFHVPLLVLASPTPSYLSDISPQPEDDSDISE